MATMTKICGDDAISGAFFLHHEPLDRNQALCDMVSAGLGLIS
jgi:hypothetical protein